MRNIIITGGELFNKGAQAMVFITVDELKKRYPDHDIYVLSELDLQRPKCEQDNYIFSFTGWYPIRFAKAQRNWVVRLMCKLRNSKEYLSAYELYSNCDLMVDISGYALCSKMSVYTCNRYLDHLEFAKAYNIPVYLMPQSFGPFDFKRDLAEELENRIKSLLPTVKTICAREIDGYNALKDNYNLNNVRLSCDLVLNNKGIDLKNIFKSVPVFDLPQIKGNSVGVIPNGMTLTVSDSDFILKMYQEIISELTKKGFKVYILSHSSTDAQLCQAIYAPFEINDNVVLLDKDFSCLEFDDIVKSFEFVVASRFHSIVHAYKNLIPCISLGWAVKYNELLKEFGQEQYSFDMREDMDICKVLESISTLYNNIDNEKLKIAKHLKVVQKDNVFDILPEKL